MLPVSQEECSMALLYAGLDVTLEMTSICVVDADSRIICERKVCSAACLRGLPGSFERVGMEAGFLSRWPYFGLHDAAFPPSASRSTHHRSMTPGCSTTFFFVTNGIEAALEQAKLAANGRDVKIGGGVETVRNIFAPD